MASYGSSLRKFFASLSQFFASLAQPQQDNPNMSHLTESEASLWADVIAGLEGEGFAYDPLTVSLPAYLATCLGEVNAHKTKAVAQMLAELNASFGGSLSELSSSIVKLLSALDGNIGEGGGGGYVGPLDLVAGAVAAYGQRALSAAMLDQPLYTIRESVGETTQIFNADAVTGAAPQADILTFIVEEGYVTLWNDQSGHANNATAQEGSEPEWMANELNSGPVIAGIVADNISMDVPSDTYANGGCTFFLVSRLGGGRFTAETEPFAYLDLAPGQSAHVEMHDGTNTAGGSFDDTPIATDEFVIWDAAFEFGTRSYRANGVNLDLNNDTDVGGAVAAIISAGQIEIGQAAGADIPAVAELIIYPSVLSAGDRTLIRANIAAYYGITLP